MGVGHKAVRKRAVGTRQRIIVYLTEAGELYDANGMASTQLAAAVGYPGSSVAFAQLLSGMERSGLIAREVRGKRTYRIGLGPARTTGPGTNARAPGLVGLAGAPAGSAAGPGDAGVAGFDYDELARRLLVQVVRRLAATEPEEGPEEASAAPDHSASPDQLALQETVNGLEYELATAWTKHGKLAEENVRLREQLKAAQRSLALAAEQVRSLPAGTDLNSHEVVVLQRLLTAGPALEGPDSSDAQTPDMLARSTGAEAAG